MKKKPANAAFPNVSAVVAWTRHDLEVRIYNTPDRPADFPTVDKANRVKLAEVLLDVLPSFDPVAQLQPPLVRFNRHGMFYAYSVQGFEPDPVCRGNEPDLFKRAAWQALLDAGMTEAKR